MPRYLTSADAARQLGVTPSAVRAMARTGRLVVAVKTDGGIQLFEMEEVQRVCNERRKILAAAKKQPRTA